MQSCKLGRYYLVSGAAASKISLGKNEQRVVGSRHHTGIYYTLDIYTVQRQYYIHELGTLNVDRQRGIVSTPFRSLHKVLLVNQEVLDSHFCQICANREVHSWTHQGTLDQCAFDERQAVLYAIKRYVRHDVSGLGLRNVALYVIQQLSVLVFRRRW